MSNRASYLLHVGYRHLTEYSSLLGTNFRPDLQRSSDAVLFRLCHLYFFRIFMVGNNLLFVSAFCGKFVSTLGTPRFCGVQLLTR